MTHDALLAYIGVVALLTITPGPDTALVLRNAVRHGWPAGVRTSAGATAGLLVWGLAASVGVAMVLATSPRVFAIIKLAGALYLAILGVWMLWNAWRHRPGPTAGRLPHPHLPVSAATLFRQGVITNLLNPRAALFFTALVPQFITAHGFAATPFILALTLIAAVANLAGQFAFAVAAHRTARLIESRIFEPILDGVVGSVLLVLGIKLVLSRRT